MHEIHNVHNQPEPVPNCVPVFWLPKAVKRLAGYLLHVLLWKEIHACIHSTTVLLTILFWSICKSTGILRKSDGWNLKTSQANINQRTKCTCKFHFLGSFSRDHSLSYIFQVYISENITTNHPDHEKIWTALLCGYNYMYTHILSAWGGGTHRKQRINLSVVDTNFRQATLKEDDWVMAE